MDYLAPISVSNWLYPEGRAADFTFWRLGHGADQYSTMRGRLSISIDIGPVNVHLRPTADEARELIRALEWALAPASAEPALHFPSEETMALNSAGLESLRQRGYDVVLTHPSPSGCASPAPAPGCPSPDRQNGGA